MKTMKINKKKSTGVLLISSLMITSGFACEVPEQTVIDKHTKQVEALGLELKKLQDEYLGSMY